MENCLVKVTQYVPVFWTWETVNPSDSGGIVPSLLIIPEIVRGFGTKGFSGLKLIPKALKETARSIPFPP
ncbi:hypothetical protein [Bacillus cereus group sp. BfR-BA-01399]|uniref:hypothetical protein n=1 Tax=Bacillus cereus group TaxID=86661 RepID=UPI001F58E834